jgi:hypothetical protein
LEDPGRRASAAAAAVRAGLGTGARAHCSHTHTCTCIYETDVCCVFVVMHVCVSTMLRVVVRLMLVRQEGEDGEEAGAAGRQTVETVKAGERILEALEVADDEEARWAAHHADVAARPGVQARAHGPHMDLVGPSHPDPCRPSSIVPATVPVCCGLSFSLCTRRWHPRRRIRCCRQREATHRRSTSFMRSTASLRPTSTRRYWSSRSPKCCGC